MPDEIKVEKETYERVAILQKLDLPEENQGIECSQRISA
jgi:hypothetical protein